MLVKNVLGSKAVEKKKKEYPWSKKRGMGTSVSEYSEAGPFACRSCWYLISMEPRKDPEGYCNEPHMLKDPDTEKIKKDGKTFAIVNKERGCCRFIDIVKPSEPKKEFIFAGDPEEEAEEHEEMNEGPGGGTPEEEEAEGEEEEEY